jgi:hypothetical protein
LHAGKPLILLFELISAQLDALHFYDDSPAVWHICILLSLWHFVAAMELIVMFAAIC